jgi:hypothetical protein
MLVQIEAYGSSEVSEFALSEAAADQMWTVSLAYIGLEAFNSPARAAAGAAFKSDL